MFFPIVQICCVGRQRVPLPLEMHRTQIWPNGHHSHVSYGSVLMYMWDKFKGSLGMLWLEGDIAITPEHIREIESEQLVHPDHVIAVPYLLYPKSTGKTRTMWSNQCRSHEGKSVAIDGESKPPSYPRYFSLGCTYLPHKLLSLVDMSRGNWDYPCLDTRLSELAYDNDIECIDTDTPALHLHY